MSRTVSSKFCLTAAPDPVSRGANKLIECRGRVNRDSHGVNFIICLSISDLHL